MLTFVQNVAQRASEPGAVERALLPACSAQSGMLLCFFGVLTTLLHSISKSLLRQPPRRAYCTPPRPVSVHSGI